MSGTKTYGSVSGVNYVTAGRDRQPTTTIKRNKGMVMTDFENQVKAAAEKAVLHLVSSGKWLQPNYESRMKVPAEWMAEMWGMVDADSVRRQLALRIESELADRMVNNMAAELATDIKQILSVKERREALRALAREHMDAVMKSVS